MKKLFLFSISALYMTGLYAQASDIEWQKSLGGSGTDIAYSIQQTLDGGYIVAGRSSSNDGNVTGNHGDSDYWIVKLNESGNLQWQKSLGGSSYDEADFIQQTTDGGYIVVGFSGSNDGDVGNSEYPGVWIVKLNESGNLEWQKSYGGSGGDVASSIQLTTDGGYIVAGSSYSNDSYPGDYWVVKLDPSGNTQWQKTLGGSEEDYATSIQQTTDGGYIVAGSSYSNDGDVSGHHGSSDTIDSWVVKLDTVGNIEWQKSLGGDDHDPSSAIFQTLDGGYVVAGFSYSNDGNVSGNHGLWDGWVVKLDAAGELQWQKSLGGSYGDSFYFIQEVNEGEYIVAGDSSSNDGDVSGNHGANDYWIVKLNNEGEILWQKSLGGTNWDSATSIQQTTDGGYIVAGFSASNDGNVTGNHGDFDYWIVKLTAENLGINEVNVGNNFSIYPNPVKGILTIEGISPNTKLVITDLNGKTVLSTTAKSNKESIDISGLPAGVYFINKIKFIKK